jgi:hypothetical protein
MDTKSEQKMFEVQLSSGLQTIVYIAADSETEAVQIIGERYDQDRFNFDWRDYEIINEVQKVPEEAVKGNSQPFRVFWKTSSGKINGLEKRENQSGAESLYWL